MEPWSRVRWGSHPQRGMWLKRGAGGMLVQRNAGQECQTQKTTQHSEQADTSTMAEGKEKCTLLSQQLFQCYGNVRLKKVNCGLCVTGGGALLSSLTRT